MSDDNVKNTYTYDEVLQASIEYFNGDVLAATVFADKYSLNNDNVWYEKTPDEMFRNRLVPEFSRIENNYKNSLTKEEIYWFFENFKRGACQGSPMYGVGNNFKLASVGNCFVVSPPHDSIGSIFKTDQELAQIMKRRGGCGTDISYIRPKGFEVNNSAKTTDGVVGFAEKLSFTTHQIAQSGGRRGALMISILCSHMQILDFIKMKRDKTKVTGANVSVKFTNEFFDCLKNNKKFILRHPAESTVENAQETMEIDPKIIWEEFIESNHQSAEPGCFFWDNLINDSISDCYSSYGFQTVSSNPCFADYTLIATKQGNVQIKDLVDKVVEIYDGKSWVTCDNFRVTGTDQELIRVTIGNFTYVDVTPYHTWYLKDGTKLQTKDLKVGMVVEHHELKVGAASRGLDDKNYEITWINQLPGKHTVYCCTVPSTGKVTLSNGITTGNCGELPLSPNSSCILMLLNLFGYVKNPFTKEVYFDFEDFEKGIKIGTRLIDDLIDIEIEKVEKIVTKIESDPESTIEKMIELNLWNDILKFLKKGRRVGLGITALADTLASLGIKYDSKESLEMCEKIFKFFHDKNFKYDCILAEERGAFECWNWEYEKENNHIKMLPQEIQDMIKKFGRRNISTTTIAPAGSVSICTQTSSGIEPVYKAVYRRRKKISPEEEKSGVKIEETDSDGNKWTSFLVYHHCLKKFMEITGKTYEESPYYKAESADVDWKYRVSLQSTCQRYVTHSISSCITADSLIDTENGLFYLDELTDFNEIPENSFKKNTEFSEKVLNKNLKRVKIDQFYNNGIKEVFNLTLTNGLQIKCTYNEKFLVLNEKTGKFSWKMLIDLKEGDRIAINHS